MRHWIPFVGAFLFLVELVSAQIVEEEAFLQGRFVEVGIAECGSFGTTANAPEGYHPRLGFGSAASLGFVADVGRDGWQEGDPDFCGDYFLPGAPEEGFSVEIDSNNFGNFARCGTFQFEGEIIDYQINEAQVAATWQGLRDGLQLTARTYIPRDKLYFVTEILLENTGEDTLRSVYYMRNVDPDNDQTLSGDFATQNTIVFQQPEADDQKALVEAIGPSIGCYLGLGAKDSRARVSRGGFSNRSASQVWAGRPPLSPEGSSLADDAISIAFFVGDIPPGACERVAFAYILNPEDLDEALTATQQIQFIANGSNITDSLATPALCPGLSQQIQILNAEDYQWTWSPAEGLDTNTGTQVMATPPVTTTYTATGISADACRPDVSVAIEVRVRPTPPAQIITDEGFVGDTLRLCNAEPFPVLFGITDRVSPMLDYFWRELGSPDVLLSTLDSLAITEGRSDLRRYEFRVRDNDIVDACNEGRDTMTVIFKPEPRPRISQAGQVIDTLRRCNRDPVLTLAADNPFDNPATQYRWLLLRQGQPDEVVSDSLTWTADLFSDSLQVAVLAIDTAFDYGCEGTDTAVVIFYPSSRLRIQTGDTLTDTVWFCDSEGPQTITASDSALDTAPIRYFWRDITTPTAPVLLDTGRSLTVDGFSQTRVYEIEVITDFPINCGGLDTLTVVFVPDPDSLAILYDGLAPVGDTLFFCTEAGPQTLMASTSTPRAEWQWFRVQADTALPILGANTSSLVVEESQTLIVELRDAATPVLCSRYDTLTVAFVPNPSLALPDTTFLCAGTQSIDLPEDENLQYAWTGPNGFTSDSAAIVPPEVGAYQLTLTEPRNGCSQNLQTVVEAPAPVPLRIQFGDADTSRLCLGDTLRLDASDTLHGPEVIYGWNIGRTVPSFAEVLTDTQTVITVQLTDTRTGCTSEDTLRFKVGAYPDLQLPVSLAFCAPSDTINLGLPNRWAYRWQGLGLIADLGDGRAVVDQAGSYTLQATNTRQGCQSESTLAVIFDTLPLLDLPDTLSVCALDTLTPLVAQDLTHGPAIAYAWFALDDTTLLATTGTYRPGRAGTYRVRVLDTRTGCSQRDTAVFVERPHPVFSIQGHAEVSCIGSDTLRLRPEEVGQAAVRWSDGSSGLSLVVRQTGIYSATLTERGCSSTQSRFVRLGTRPPLPSFPDTLRLCQGDSLRLDAFAARQGQVRYRWIDLADGRLLAETAQLTLTYAGQARQRILRQVSNQDCNNSDTLHVYWQSQETVGIRLSDTLLCLGQSIQAIAEGSGDVVWDDGSTAVERVFVPERAGRYTLTLTHLETGVCAARTTVREVEVLPAPQRPSLDTAYVRCVGDSLFLDAATKEQPLGSSYRWESDQGRLLSDRSAFWLTADGLGQLRGQVYLEISVGTCATSDTLAIRFVEPPRARFRDTPLRDSLCLGDTQKLQAEGAATYRWNTGDTTATIDFVGQTVGLTRLWLSVRDPEGVCPETRDTLLRWVLPLPDVRLQNAPAVACQGDTLTLTASGAAAYRWQSDGQFLGNTDTLRLLAQTQAIQLQGTDTNGCTNTTTAALRVVEQPDIPDLVQGCRGDTLRLGVDRPDASADYFWQETAQTTPQIRVLRGGTYTLEVRQDECRFVQPIRAIFEEYPRIFLLSDTVFCFEDGLPLVLRPQSDLGDGVLLDWLWDDGTRTPERGIEAAGDFGVQLTARYAQRACISRARIGVRARCLERVFVPDAFTPNEDGLNDRFVIFGKNIGDFSLEIFDRWGILRHRLRKPFDQITPADWWDGRGFPVGTYTWVIAYEGVEGWQRKTGQVQLLR